MMSPDHVQGIAASRVHIPHGEVIRCWSFYQSESLSDTVEQRTPRIHRQTFAMLRH